MTTTKRGLQRFYEYRDRIKGFISQIEQSPAPNPVLLKFFSLVLENDEKTIDCVENDKPFLSSAVWQCAGDLRRHGHSLLLPCFQPPGSSIVYR